jgi:predicted RNA methylase
VSLQLVMPGSPPPPDDKLSQWDTPRPLAERIAAWAGVEHGMRVLEPSAGLGSLARAARTHGADVRCVELSRGRCDFLERDGFTVTHGDFLSVPAADVYHLVLTNPPYESGQGTRHIAHALRFARVVVALLDIDFLATKDRYEAIWRHHGLRRMAVPVTRPKFSGARSTGMHDSAVFEIVRDAHGIETRVEHWQ